jgi:HTH-type transcriptional regulator/antitoxin HigA
MEEKNKIVPFLAVAPGATLKAELEARNIKQKDFAKALGMQATHLSELIKGKRAISPKVASDLERELGINAKFWMRLQAEYEYDCEAIKKRSIEEQKAQLLLNEYNEMININLIFKRIGVAFASCAEKLDYIIHQLRLPKPAELKYNLGKFRKSEKSGTDQRAIYTWEVLAQHAARQQQTNQSYKPENFGYIQQLADVFNKNKDVIENTRKILSDNGIRFCIVEKIDKASIDGYSFLDTDGIPSIVVTKRYDRIDNFAFAVMHEIGHLMLHVSETEKRFINLMEDTKEEQEANTFACNHLIPEKLWKSTTIPQVQLNKPWLIETKYSQWAKENNLHKWIVLGRISHETGMYKFKNDESRKIH